MKIVFLLYFLSLSNIHFSLFFFPFLLFYSLSFFFFSHPTFVRTKSAIAVQLSRFLMLHLVIQVFSNAHLQVVMQSSRFPTHLIHGSMLQKSKFLLQTIVLSEVLLEQLRLVALFVLVLVMAKSAVLFVYRVGSLFLVACLQLAEETPGMMHL